MILKRTCEQTHPWLNFRLDLNRLSPDTWVALGEAVSKSEHVAGVPLAPQIAKRMHEIYLAKGVLATTAIEGNTLSEEEVRDYLDGKLKLPDSREYLGKEIENILRICNKLTRDVAESGKPPVLTVEKIKWMNAEALKGLSVDESVEPGKIRSHSVGVGRYRCAQIGRASCRERV